MLEVLALFACVSRLGHREGTSIALTDRDGHCASEASWRACYPGSTVRCYTDADIAEAVRGTRWERVWPTLRPVERADVWRYLHVWRHGGIYADADAFCVRPLPNRALTVGIEAMPHSVAEARRVRIVYPVQYVQWVFAAAKPEHPALMAALNTVYGAWERKTTRDTLNFTGPGAFTRAIAPFVTDALPQEAFACNGYGGVGCGGAGVLVRHAFRSSWRVSL